MQRPIAEVPRAITRPTHTALGILANQVYEEVVNHFYNNRRGKPGSPAKALRMFGFKEKSKKKLLLSVQAYLANVNIIEVPNAYDRDVKELTE